MKMELCDRSPEAVLSYFHMTRDPEVCTFLPQKKHGEEGAGMESVPALCGLSNSLVMSLRRRNVPVQSRAGTIVQHTRRGGASVFTERYILSKDFASACLLYVILTHSSVFFLELFSRGHVK